VNWFDILKEQRQIARNVQSFKPIQFDKPIKIKKPEKTCYEKLVEYIQSKFEMHINAEEFYSNFLKYRGEGNFRGELYHWKDIHDNLYCIINQQLDDFITNIDSFYNQTIPTGINIHGLNIWITPHFKLIQQGKSKSIAKKPHLISFIIEKADATKNIIIRVTSSRDKPEEENA